VCVGGGEEGVGWGGGRGVERVCVWGGGGGGEGGGGSSSWTRLLRRQGAMLLLGCSRNLLERVSCRPGRLQHAQTLNLHQPPPLPSAVCPLTDA
jgi:hypothetical protein